MVEDDLITAVVTASGTHQAAFMGVAPTGNKVTWSSIDIWRVRDGKITDVWHDVPNEDILQQQWGSACAALEYLWTNLRWMILDSDWR